ncbi:MAG: hypothetical protein ACYTGC_10025 [Planctomycetota bacterium]|jgi:hypothetical protein
MPRPARLWITDARGRKVEPLDPAILLLRHDDDVIDRDTLRGIVREIGPGIEKWPRRASIVGVAGVALAMSILGVRLVSMTISTGAFPVGELSQRLPIFIGIAAGLWFHWFAARRVRLSRVRAVMLEHRRCPHCGYDLRALPEVEEDAGVVCPECGCAWPLGG